MKLRFLLPLALLALAGFVVACEIEEDADAVDNDTGTTATCEPACDTGFHCVGTTCVEDEANNLEYRFVRVDDLSAKSETPDGGADIDSITIFKQDGAVGYADEVKAYEHGGGNGDALDTSQALGAPDAFYDYPDTDLCEVGDDTTDDMFLSLGGLGGYLVVHMSETIEEGDTLEVLEVGDCDFGSGTAIPEDVEVSVSVAEDPDNTYWVNLGSGTGPDISFVIPNLPEVSAD